MSLLVILDAWPGITVARSGEDHRRGACAVPGLQRSREGAPRNIWETDGEVNVIVEHGGGVIYVGGDFSYMGPHTGSGVALSPASGSVGTTLPQVEGGFVHAVAPDGAGGFYIGGTFTAVGGVARHALAHIRADGTVDPHSDRRVSGYSGIGVEALSLSGSTVYVGGLFRSVDGLARNRLAAVDATSGAVLAWDPKVSRRKRWLRGSGGACRLGFDRLYRRIVRAGRWQAAAGARHHRR